MARGVIVKVLFDEEGHRDQSQGCRLEMPDCLGALGEDGQVVQFVSWEVNGQCPELELVAMSDSVVGEEG